MNLEIEIHHYLDRAGKDIFGDWFSGMRDLRAKAKIATRIARMAAGNFGDYKALRGGLCELRIDWGPGYRVYFAMVGKRIILLLSGGDKRNQSSDVARGLMYLEDYKARIKKDDET